MGKRAKIRIRIKNGIIENQDGVILGTILDTAPENEVAIIANSGEAFEKIGDFVDNVNSGTLKPRAAVKEFEKVLEKTDV